MGNRGEVMNEQEFEKVMEKGVELFKENLRVTARFLIANLIPVWNRIKEISEVLDYKKIEKSIKRRKLLYKLNLDRPLIRHQVISRKPRYLVKKIIH